MAGLTANPIEMTLDPVTGRYSAPIPSVMSPNMPAPSQKSVFSSGLDPLPDDLSNIAAGGGIFDNMSSQIGTEPDYLVETAEMGDLPDFGEATVPTEVKKSENSQMMDLVKQSIDQFKGEEGSGMGSKIGAGAGTAIGGVVGSFVPVVGTMAGAAIGGALGGATGSILDWWGDKQYDTINANNKFLLKQEYNNLKAKQYRADAKANNREDMVNKRADDAYVQKKMQDITNALVAKTRGRAARKGLSLNPSARNSTMARPQRAGLI